MAHHHVDGQIILLSYTENNTFLYKQKNLTNVVRIIEQRIGRIRFAEERQPGVLALERQHPPDRPAPHGLIQESSTAGCVI